MRSPRELTPSSRPSLVGSFRHALRGLVEVAASERNMRIHLFAGIAVGVAASELPFSLPARLSLFLCVMLVLAGELLNSALEALVDLHTLEFRAEARRVKDAAAGAVALLAAGAVLSAVVIVSAHEKALAGSWPRVAPHLFADGGLLAAAGVLLSRRAPRGVVVLASAAGAVLLGVLAVWSVSWPFTVMTGGLFAVAAAATLRRGEGEVGR